MCSFSPKYCALAWFDLFGDAEHWALMLESPTKKSDCAFQQLLLGIHFVYYHASLVDSCNFPDFVRGAKIAFSADSDLA